MRKVGAGLGSLLLLVVLLVGIPVGLLFVAGNPIPSLDEIQRGLFYPDLSGGFLIGTVLPLIGWAAWATFALGFLVELPGQIRRVPSPRLPGLRLQQATMAVLLAAVIGMVSIGGGIGASTASAAEPASPSVSASAPASQQPAAPVTQEQEAPAPEQETAAAFEQVVVDPGETMWGVAQEELGDGSRYDEIYAATSGVQQPVMGPITDADLIYPGQVLNVPTDAVVEQPAASVEPAPQPAPQPAPETAGDVAVPATADADVEAQDAAGGASGATSEADADDAAEPVETEDSSTSPVSSTTDADTAADVDDVPDFADMMLMTAGGIGALLAAGVLKVWGFERIRRRRHRKPGERTVATTPDIISDVELELRTVERPHDMESIDRVLRYLGGWAQQHQVPLPEIYALRNAPDELSIYLADSATLPEPFVSVTEGDVVWSVDVDAVPELEQGVAAPYPALVTVGRDVRGAFLMLDLEYFGAIAIHGTPDLTRGAMTALALELATSEWGEGLQVTLVGVAPDLPPALATTRLRHVDDLDALLAYLRTQAEATRRSLDAQGQESTLTARTTFSDADAWAPEIVLLSEAPSAEIREELGRLMDELPRVGLAIVSTEQVAGEWAITIESSEQAVLEPLGLAFTPQLVSDEEYAAIRDRFVELEQPLVPAPETFTATESVDVDEAPATSHVRRVEDVPADATADIMAAARALVPAHDGPHMTVFGNVGITGHADVYSGRPSTHQWLEIASLITLHPGGVSAEDLHRYIWGTKEFWKDESATKRRDQVMSRVRRWLGVNADGNHCLEDRTGGDGYSLYRITGVSTDWSDFVELADPTRVGSTDTPELVAALLLADTPFADARPRKYGWTSDLVEEMKSAISDVANEVAQRSLEHGDLELARFAMRVARKIDPSSEVHWRTLLRIEDRAHNRPALEQILDDFYRELEDYEPGTEPEAETQILIDRLYSRGVLTG